MKHIKLYENYRINELISFGIEEDNDGKYALVSKENLWVFDYETYEDYSSDMCYELGLDETDLSDVDEFIEAILQKDTLSHIVIGRIEKPYFVVNANRSYRISRLSPDTKKLMSTLGLSTIRIEHSDVVNRENDIESEEEVELKQELKNATFYHGTTIDSLKSITRKGLIPRNRSGVSSSYKNISHKDKIFVTLNREAAYGHSMNSSIKNNSFPILLELNLPDISKLDLDFDIAMNYLPNSRRTKELGYTAMNKGRYTKDSGINNIQNKLGEFSYLGRIPASFIKSVRIDIDLYREYLDEKINNGEETFDWQSHYEDITHDVDYWKKMSLEVALQTMYEINNEI